MASVGRGKRSAMNAALGSKAELFLGSAQADRVGRTGCRTYWVSATGAQQSPTGPIRTRFECRVLGIC